MKHLLLLCLLVLFCPQWTIEAQTKKLAVSGTVLDSEGTPVTNAIILVDGKATKVRSDNDGNYSVKIKTSAQRIGVVAAGVGLIEEEIDNRNQIDFMYDRIAPESAVSENSANPDATIENTGYSTIRKRYAAVAVGFLDVEHSKKKYASIEQILMETPGLIFLNGMYVVAGSRNFGGVVPPLYVVDDIPVSSLPSISPSQVACVTVLKGSSAAIYGARAFGGAVLITTKISE